VNVQEEVKLRGFEAFVNVRANATDAEPLPQGFEPFVELNELRQCGARHALHVAQVEHDRPARQLGGAAEELLLDELHVLFAEAYLVAGEAEHGCSAEVFHLQAPVTRLRRRHEQTS